MNTAKTTAIAGLAAMTALLNSGTLTIYSGAMPATPETALSGNTALVVFTFSATAFAAATFAANLETQASTFVNANMAPVASGTAAFARLMRSDGVTVFADMTVGTAGLQESREIAVMA